MNRKVLIPIIIAAALAALGARSFFKRDNSLTASGTLEARNVSVGSKIGGRITHGLVAEGDHPKKDQLPFAFADAQPFTALLQKRRTSAHSQPHYTPIPPTPPPPESAHTPT